jgi:hypothetical protein
MVGQPAGNEATLKRIGLVLVILLLVSAAAAGGLLAAVARGNLSHRFEPFILAELAVAAGLGVVGVYLRTTAVNRLGRPR